MTHFELHTGDCIDVLRTIPAGSVDSIVTSPPYAMQRGSTYGGVPEADYPEWTVAWMEEARRVLTDDGSAIINIRPHFRNGQISDYVLRTRLALREAGWAELEELIWDKKSGAPWGSIYRPRRSWESLLWFGKHGRAFCDPKAAGPKMKGAASRMGGGRAARNGWTHLKDQPPPDKVRTGGVARVPDIARIPLSHHGGADRPHGDHPAPFPWQLAEWCGKLITPPGGTILDPFTGSSSTGVAAIKNGWHFIGIDQSQEYIDMSRKRLESEQDKLGMPAS